MSSSLEFSAGTPAAEKNYRAAIQCCGFAECTFLSDDQQCHVWNYIKNKENNLEYSKERVKDNIESFPGDRKPFFLGSVHQIRKCHKQDGPNGQDGTIDDRAPHKKRCQSLNFQDILLNYFLTRGLDIRRGIERDPITAPA